MQEAAATAFLNLASLGSQSNSDAISAAGALPLLAALFESDQPAVQIGAAGALANLSHNSQKTKDDIIAANAVPLLVSLLRSDQPAMQEHAAVALKCLASGSQSNRDAITAAGAVPLLVTLAGSDQLAVPVAPAAALKHLASSSPHIKDSSLHHKDVSGEVGMQHPAGSGTQDTELPQLCGGTQACMSFPVDVEDDSDDDLQCLPPPELEEHCSSSNASAQLPDLAWETASVRHAPISCGSGEPGASSASQ